MAVRPTAEMVANFKALMGENMTDEAVNFLEDLTDSTQQIDTANYVEKSQYDQIVQERDRYRNQAEDYRSRYINRFYTDYNEPNNKGYVESGTSQGRIERDEKDVSYEDLFE